MKSKRPVVALFYTCLVNSLKPNIGFASVKLLETAGYTVEIPMDQTCCGRPAFNSGDRELSRKLARQAVTRFENFDYVVGPSGSCLSMFVNHYPDLLKEEGTWYQRAVCLSKKSFELTDFLVRVAQVENLPLISYDGCATYHDSCTGLRELNIKKQPRDLLKTVNGLRLVEMKSAETCCGFGGTFSVKYPEISTRLVDDKIAAILQTNADTVIGGDLGCLMNIEGRLNRIKKQMRVHHIAEILAGLTHDASD